MDSPDQPSHESSNEKLVSNVPYLEYQLEKLHFDGQNLQTLAENYSTPLYVYSQKAIREAFESLNVAFTGARICYAVKANPNISLLKLLNELGAGFDIVSEGELQRVLLAGGDPQKVVFSGVAKSDNEIIFALKQKIFCFNVESLSELRRINDIAGEMKVSAPVSIRINPDIDPHTHEYISTGLKKNKFGISNEKVMEIYKAAKNMNNIEIKGIDCHIGSQICIKEPFLESLRILVGLVDQLEEIGISLNHIDIGGGIGIRYKEEKVISISEYAKEAREIIGPRKIELILEPGRFIVANAGVLLTKTVYIKENVGKNFALIDAGMNDLIRPSLYQAYHPIVPVSIKERVNAELKTYDVVGPVCETGDFLGKDRKLKIEEGDILCVLASGAYGSSMGSNYNSRPRPAELLIMDSKAIKVIRRRETFEGMIKDEIGC